MAEPTSATAAAAATAVAAATVPPLMLLGISTGLRADMLLAGFAGSLAAIVLINSVPASGDTWVHMLRTTLRRMATAAASAALSGYLTPAVMELGHIPASMALALALAFVVGAGAQRMLQVAVSKLTASVEKKPVEQVAPDLPSGGPDK